MDVTFAIGVLSAFLVVFIFFTGVSIRQGEKVDIDRDVELIRQRIISDKIIPAVLEVFEYEPTAYREGESELEDKLASKLDPSIGVIARVLKCRDLARQLRRYTFWCSTGGIFLEIVFIFLVAYLGACTTVVTATIGTSFVALVLCLSFVSLRQRNLDALDDIKEGI